MMIQTCGYPNDSDLENIRQRTWDCVRKETRAANAGFALGYTKGFDHARQG